MLRLAILSLGIVYLFRSEPIFAQENPDVIKERVHFIESDTASHPVQGIDRVMTLEKYNSLPLESLLGLTKAHAMPTIVHFDHSTLREHGDYPFIKDVVRVNQLSRWKYPILLYIFFDNADQICRLTYKIGYQDGMSEPEGRAIIEQLRKEHTGLNVQNDSDRVIAEWEDYDRYYFFTWYKDGPVIKPVYSLITKSYADDKLLPYLKTNEIIDDGIFTSIPSWMFKQ